MYVHAIVDGPFDLYTSSVLNSTNQWFLSVHFFCRKFPSIGRSFFAGKLEINWKLISFRIDPIRTIFSVLSFEKENLGTIIY